MTRIPFRGLNYYRFEDADLFFGREEETRKMVGEILSTRLLVLFSPSGSGKTSLIQAGVRPQLEQLGYKTIYTRLESEPILSIYQAVSAELDIPVSDQKLGLHDFLNQGVMKVGKPLVIFLDQFEEFFIMYRDRLDLRTEFVNQVATIRRDDTLHVFIVLSLREDYFALLHEFSEVIPSIFQYNANIHLKPFTVDAARRALAEPVKVVGSTIDDELIGLLIKDLRKAHFRIEEELKREWKLKKKKKSEAKKKWAIPEEEIGGSFFDEKVGGVSSDWEPCIDPIQLQIVCNELWNRRDEKESRISKEIYENCGGAKTIINGFVQERLEKIPRHKLRRSEKIFYALKTPDNTKRYRSLEDLITGLNIKRKKPFMELLGELEALDILRCEEGSGTTWYEFRHDYLVQEVVGWMEKKREKRIRKRILYAGLPGILLFLVLFFHYFMEYNTFYAEFADKEYPYQKEEIIITRGFNLFNKKIYTGFYKNDLLDYSSENAVKNKLKVSFEKNNWNGLVNNLNKLDRGKFFYKIGKVEEGFALFNEVLNEDCFYFFRIIEKLIRFDKRAFNLLRNSTRIEDINAVREAFNTMIEISKNTDDNIIINMLIQMLKNKNLSIQYHAIYALGEIGKPNPEIIVELKSLINEEAGNSFNAAIALAKLGKADSKVIEFLTRHLKDKDSIIRSIVIEALGSVANPGKKAVEELCKLMKNPNLEIRESTSKALGNLAGSYPEALNALIKAYKDSDENVRTSVASAFEMINKPEKKLIDVLMKLLIDKNSNISNYAQNALVKFCKLDNRIIVFMVQTLKNTNLDSSLRYAVANTLGILGRTDNHSVNVLVEILIDRNSNDDSLGYAAIALGQTGKLFPKVVNTLFWVLKKNKRKFHKVVLIALAKILKKDESTLDALIEVLGEKGLESYLNCTTAYSALYKIEKPEQEIIDALYNALESSDKRIKYSAARALVSIGIIDNKIIQILIQTIKTFDPFFKDGNTTIKLIGDIGLDDTKIIDILIESLKGTDNDIRFLSAQSLGEIGKLDSNIIEALKITLRDEEEYISISASEALAKLLQSKNETQLLALLQDYDSGTRTAASYALVEKYKTKKLSKKTLKKLEFFRTKDVRPWVRLSAWKTFYLFYKKEYERDLF